MYAKKMVCHLPSTKTPFMSASIYHTYGSVMGYDHESFPPWMICPVSSVYINDRFSRLKSCITSSGLCVPRMAKMVVSLPVCGAQALMVHFQKSTRIVTLVWHVRLLIGIYFLLLLLLLLLLLNRLNYTRNVIYETMDLPGSFC